MLKYNVLCSMFSFALLGSTSQSQASNLILGDDAEGTRNTNITVVGENAKANFVHSTAIGSEANAWGQSYSTVVGSKAESGGENSVVVGAEAKTNGTSGTAIGTESFASESSVAVGKGVKADGQSSVALGMSSKSLGGSSIAIKGASEGNYSIAIGDQSSSKGSQSIATGREASSSGSMSITIGDTASSSGGLSIAMGHSASSQGSGSISIGDRSQSTNNSAISIGQNSKSSAQSATALGYQSEAEVQNGVALGSQSTASRDAGIGGYIPDGVKLTDEEKNSSTWKSTLAEVSVGSDGKTRQITHVAAGSEDTDAVNVAQLKAVNSRIVDNMSNQFDQIEEQFAQTFSSMSHRLDTVQKEANAGVATAIAIAGLPQAYLPGKSMFSMSASSYLGEQGYAMGVSHIMQNGHVILKVTGSGNSQGHFGGSVGAGYQW